MSESNFLRHAPCPAAGCNSSDGLAVYDDHEHCFVCGYDKQYKKKKLPPRSLFRQ